MRKIPTIFARDMNSGFVYNSIVSGTEWVFQEESIPRYKWDGTATYFDGKSWFARHTVKPGKFVPMNFVKVQHDMNTGKSFGWLPIQESSFYNAFIEAFEHVPFESDLYNRFFDYEEGTYELIGPKVNKNPENLKIHRLVSHKNSPILDNLNQIDYSFDTLKAILTGLPCEGVVWYGSNGKMAKLKGKDFGV